MGLFGKKKKKPAQPPVAVTETTTETSPKAAQPGGHVIDWIATNASLLPDKLATVDVHSGRRHTYAQMNARVAGLAGYLASLGVVKGDRVCTLSLNSTDMLDIMFACWRIGAVHLPLNFRLTAPELVFIVNDSSPKVAFIDQTFADTAADLQKETSITNWIEMDGSGGDTVFERGIATSDPIRKQIDLIPTDLAVIMYSSGTTGRPKGVTLDHENMLYGAVFNLTASIGVARDSVGLTMMPLFHIGGLNAYNTPVLYLGGTTVIVRNFEPGEALNLIGDPGLGITHLLGVPAIFNALKAHPSSATADFSRIQVASAGAEAVPEALVNWWKDERNLIVQEVYGMTETCGGACFLQKSDIPDKIGSAGKALHHTQFLIVDDNGDPVPPGEKGEIWMRGPNITKGYWNRPEANEKSFKDGWLMSGDIGRMDAEGYIYIEDRVKDMYISGGENVYPAEVENALYELEEIAEVAVIGVPDSRWGEVGCAVIALKPGQALTMSEIAAHCESRLARYKHPTHMAVVDALPRNATGKVLKFELRQTIPPTLELR